ncbi:CLUMA_CG017084, isoform A [Clunio marinus]|uniref:CLUMA_CG017084, isoform A n=1 Tax=Clunio marinus TaxID=568069 RepID=A0A1J1IUM4_9DIPT|nr:CLUMA_CG017084, isoform A [Clunio marinus]
MRLRLATFVATASFLSTMLKVSNMCVKRFMEICDNKIITYNGTTQLKVVHKTSGQLSIRM